MSWSVNAIGKSAAVAASIEKQFAAHFCNEPEETVRQSARATIASALAAQTKSNTAVKVMASGSQSSYGTDGFTNNLSITIEPQYGFVE